MSCFGLGRWRWVAFGAAFALWLVHSRWLCDLSLVSSNKWSNRLKPEALNPHLDALPSTRHASATYLRAIHEMHLDLAIADMVDLMSIHEDMDTDKEGERPPLPQYHIKYPDGFDPDMIDKTIPEMREWVEKLISHKFKKFSCLESISKHIPNPNVTRNH